MDKTTMQAAVDQLINDSFREEEAIILEAVRRLTGRTDWPLAELAARMHCDVYPQGQVFSLYGVKILDLYPAEWVGTAPDWLLKRKYRYLI